MEEKNGQIRRQELILAGMAFTFYWMINLHKLVNASLWFDEAVEY